MAGSWARNFKWTVVGTAVGKGAVFVTNIILARELGASGYGILAAAQAFAAYLWIAADLGIGFYGSREVARTPELRVPLISALWGLRILAGLLASCCGGLVALLLFDGATSIAYAVAASQVLFLAMTLDWALRGTQHFRTLAHVSMAGGVTLVAGSALIALLPGALQHKLYLFLTVWVASQAAMAGVAWVKVKHILGIGIAPSREQWRLHLSHSAFFALSTGVVTAAQFMPILALNHMSNSEAAGLFSAPYWLVLSIIIAVHMLTTSAYPILAENHAHDQQRFFRQFVRTRNTVILVAVVIGMALALFPDEIVHLLYGNEYDGSAPILVILGLLVPLATLRGAYGATLFASNAERLHLLGSVPSLALWIVAGIPLISTFGAHGAAWGCILSESAAAAGMIWGFSKHCNRQAVR